MSKELEINKELVLSTSHVPEHTATYLNFHEDTGFTVYQCEFTFRMHVSRGSGVHDCDEHPELQVLAKLAQEQGCKWLVLDCDGNTYDELPTFEW